MSPANIEQKLKSPSPLIGQAICIGDARPYNVALLVLDPDVSGGVATANALSRVEQIKRFTILPVDWEPGGEELTPTMKIKRKPIHAKYTREIGALYAD